MDTRQRTLLIIASITAPIVMVGCSGNTDGGSAADKHPETQFVATDGTVGTIDLILEEPTLNVGDVGGFAVIVKDSFGNGVPHIKVACDTEQGLALTEPTSGIELTNINGAMSGSYGCASKGSLQIGCRVPIGANRRIFKSVRCEGDVPAGFTGFPGAGGGGLGGGVSQPGDGGSTGGTGSSGVRITALRFYDTGATDSESAGAQVDVVSGICDEGPPQVNEPFFDTFVGVTVKNNGNSSLTVISLRYTVPNASGAGTFQSGELNIPGDATVGANGGTTEFFVPVFIVGGGGKNFSDASGANTVPIDSTLGIRNIVVHITAIDGDGNAFGLDASAAVVFGDYNRCA